VKIYKIKKRPFSKKVSVIWPIKNKDKFLENIPILLSDSLKDKLYSLLFKLWQN
jgi:tRNA A37 threonylcarbamoyladenosine synthetase subunit TsaC/SUA5/YrdC